MIKEAQHDNQEAINQLCERFKLLIYKEASRTNIYNALGEDAVNIAWTIFLSFIRRYNGADYEHLPGLIQCHLYYELNHSVCKKGLCWDNEVADLDELSENLPVCQDTFQSIIQNMALYQELKKLTPRQLKIIWLYYFANKSHEAIAKILHCSPRTVGYQRVQALKKLKLNML